MTSAREWTPAELKTLKEMFAAGASDSEISCALKTRTETAVNRMRGALKLNRGMARPYSEEELQTLRRLYDEGAPYDAIAAAIGRTRSGVKVKCVQLGWSRNTKHAPRKPEPPIGKGLEYNTIKREESILACRDHLIDLMRAYGKKGGALGEAKARYRSRCEYDVVSKGARRVTHFTQSHGSLLGSHFAEIVA